MPPLLLLCESPSAHTRQNTVKARISKLTQLILLISPESLSPRYITLLDAKRGLELENLSILRITSRNKPDQRKAFQFLLLQTWWLPHSTHFVASCATQATSSNSNFSDGVEYFFNEAYSCSIEGNQT